MDTPTLDIELQSHPNHGLSKSHTTSQDDQHLMRLGKKPLLKRSFGFMSLLGFSCSVLITWEGILATSIGALLNGGPAGVVWGFLIVMIGTLSTFATLGELASMAPVAGGQYHWVAILAPPSCRNFLSYITAWVTVFGWQAIAASSGLLLAVLIEGITALTRPTYISHPWHTVLLFWALSIFAVVVNSTTGRFLARFEGAVLILHLVGFFCVLIPLVYLGPHASAKDVFTVFTNTGGWSSQALSFLVGMPSSVFCLMGADSAVHMSEEIISAATVVPKALVYSIVINGSLAWAMVIAMVFCMGSLEDALEGAATLGYPFIEIFYQAVNSRTGAAIMASIILIMGMASIVGVYAASSRMLWSFARDRGVPFHHHLVKLTKRTSLPIYAVLVTLVFSMLLALIPLGSTVAFNNVISLAVAGLYASYLIVSVLLLWRRLRGDMKPFSPFDSSLPDSNALNWGPWKISEPLGTINNVFACLYLVFIWFWSFWPPSTPTTPATMNFSVLVFGATVLFSVLYYMFRGRQQYDGPVREIDLDAASFQDGSVNLTEAGIQGLKQP